MTLHLLKNSLLLFTALFLLSSQTHALFLIDPYIGYKKSSAENGTTPTVEYDYNSLTYGARLGLKKMGFSIGADYSMASADLEAETSGIKVAEAHDQKQLGIFLGYDLPAMFRFWGTYLLDVEFEDTDGSDSGDTLNGKGYGLGVGYTGLPFVSINFEYKMYTIDESTSNGVTNTLAAANEIDFKEMMVSLSIPLDL